MKIVIAIPSMKEGGLEDIVNPNFGRCKNFTFVELKEGEIDSVKVVQNEAMNAMGGAGIQAGGIIGNNNATAAIIGSIGPNAVESLNALNIETYQAPEKQITIKEAVNLFKKNALKKISSANVGSHYGLGGQG